MDENEKASDKKCKELLKKLFFEMSERVKKGEYSRCGGYAAYCRDRDAIIEKYHIKPNKGVRAEAVLNEFMNERGPEANNILQTDIKLTEKEREVHEEREKKTLMEQKFKEEKQKRIESELMMEAEIKRQKDKIKQMEKINKEMEQQQKEMERALKSNLKEHEELLKKGFKEKSDLLGQNIKKFQEEEVSVGEVVGKFIGNVEDILPNLLTGTGFQWRF